ncbi:hypothetical protein C8J57DRAFT_1530226 [Mycena rebaudengoi]|nr:hypothetical protein C8J57DRAFT_1541263 [Mycena rebaudengoi]KAJ7236121.1 hypothetical protein C8J57DRAFT_1530226 [Mycena rebaudengoi]
MLDVQVELDPLRRGEIDKSQTFDVPVRSPEDFEDFCAAGQRSREREGNTDKERANNKFFSSGTHQTNEYRASIRRVEYDDTERLSALRGEIVECKPYRRVIYVEIPVSPAYTTVDLFKYKRDEIQIPEAVSPRKSQIDGAETSMTLKAVIQGTGQESFKTAQGPIAIAVDLVQAMGRHRIERNRDIPGDIDELPLNPIRVQY